MVELVSGGCLSSPLIDRSCLLELLIANLHSVCQFTTQLLLHLPFNCSRKGIILFDFICYYTQTPFSFYLFHVRG